MYLLQSQQQLFSLICSVVLSSWAVLLWAMARPHEKHESCNLRVTEQWVCKVESGNSFLRIVGGTLKSSCSDGRRPDRRSGNYKIMTRPSTVDKVSWGLSDGNRGFSLEWMLLCLWEHYRGCWWRIEHESGSCTLQIDSNAHWIMHPYIQLRLKGRASRVHWFQGTLSLKFV